VSAVAKHVNETGEYLVDSCPSPVGDHIRIGRCHRYRGYLASKRRYFFDLRIPLLVTLTDHPVAFVLTLGRTPPSPSSKPCRSTCPQAPPSVPMRPIPTTARKIFWSRDYNSSSSCPAQSTPPVRGSRAHATAVRHCASGVETVLNQITASCACTAPYRQRLVGVLNSKSVSRCSLLLSDP